MKSAIENKMGTLEDNINLKMCTLENKMEEMMKNQKSQALEQKV